MQVHHIHQETPDVWTLSLLCHDYYPYRAGQYALVSVRNSAETLRAYTISSTPGVSEYITLTVRRIDDGAGSQWLTRDVKRGDYIWLSDAQGDFTCDDKTEDKFLLLAAGCNCSARISSRPRKTSRKCSTRRRTCVWRAVCWCRSMWGSVSLRAPSKPCSRSSRSAPTT